VAAFLEREVPVRRRKTILAAVAVVFLALGGLACRPAWHPSGKSVAFPFLDGEVSGIAVYDLGTDKVRRLLEEKGNELSASQCLWTSDGKKLIVTVPGSPENRCRVMTLNPESGKASPVAKFENADLFCPLSPILVKDRYLWISGMAKQPAAAEDMNRTGFCAQIDLTNGKVREFFAGKKTMTWCYDLGKAGFFYLRFSADEEGAGRAAPKGKQRNGIELGTFDPETGASEELATLDTEAAALAADSDGTRLAGLTMKKKADGEQGSCVLLLDRKGKVLKEIPVAEDAKDAVHLAWAGGGIWIPAAMAGDEREGKQGFGILRVDVETGKTQFILLKDGRSEDTGRRSIQPSVSPDGKRLAVMGSLLLEGNEKERPTALVILDVAAPDKAPVKIPLPAGKAPAGEKKRPDAAE
jgi:hypothetical protein